MNKVVYTCIYGDYDDLKEPVTVSDGWDYICFTDQDLKSKTWKIVKEKPHTDNRLACRMMWTYPYDYLNGYDIALSVGGQIQIKTDLNDYLDMFCDLDKLNVLNHPDRQCVYKEGLEIALRDKDSWRSVFETLNKYYNLGMPRDNGLYATGIIIRDLNNKVIKDFCEHWQKQLFFGSFRDQLSLAFCVWKYDFINNLNLLDFEHIRSRYFKIKRHKYNSVSR